jgi:hypothetical protein
MTTREATDSEMLSAVERWARARGFHRDQHAHGSSDGLWLFSRHHAPREFGTQLHAGRMMAIWDRNGERFDVDARAALLVALLIEGGLTVDVGRCPACVKRGGPHEWTQIDETRGHVSDALSAAEWFAPRLAKTGWIGASYIHHTSPRGATARLVAKRPCPDCNGTGRHTIEAARLVLDAVWRTIDGLVKPAKYGRAKCRGCGYGIATTRAGLIRSHTGPGPGPRCSGSKQRPDTAARDSLHVKADDLQRTGDPLGEWLSLWLAGSRERTDDMTLRLMEVAWRAEIMHGEEPSRGVG